MFKFGAIKNWLQLSVSFIISFIASKNDSVFMLVTAQFKKYKKNIGCILLFLFLVTIFNIWLDIICAVLLFYLLRAIFSRNLQYSFQTTHVGSIKHETVSRRSLYCIARNFLWWRTRLLLRAKLYWNFCVSKENFHC